MNFYVAAFVLAIIALVVALYSYLYLQYRHKFLTYLLTFWILFFAKIVFDFLVMSPARLSAALPLWLVITNQIHTLLGSWLLLMGTYGFIGQHIRKSWKLGLMAAVVLGLFMCFFNGTYQYSILPAVLYMSSVMGWSGIILIRRKDLSTFGRYLAGGALVIWAVHVLDKPFLQHDEAFIPWGYVIGAFLSLLTGLGILLIYFSKMRQELLSSKNELEDAEQTLSYLNLHDSLTGLYNRLYFEERLSSIQNSGNYESVGLAVFDIEGLKLVNDTLGHMVGDQILIHTANLLTQAFLQCDTIARIGGDEFAVIQINTTQEQLEVLSVQLGQLISRHNSAKPNVPLGITCGIMVNRDLKKNLFEVYKDAENAMHRNRMKNSNIARIAIVNTLGRAIQEKDYLAKDHSPFMMDIMEMMGLSLKMNREKIEELRQLALFHDIGKVGIPEHILAKPGPLNKEEMTEMRRHSEIGARIAQTSPQLAHLNDYILKHHERWDGKGYPLGIKGEEIPLECRILALADSYDAMSSHRPYRPALPQEQVIAELRRCSGTQFDPNLVELFISLLDQEPGKAATNQKLTL